jgi:hypothetical protein
MRRKAFLPLRKQSPQRKIVRETIVISAFSAISAVNMKLSISW